MKIPPKLSLEFAWLVDPKIHTLEAYQQVDGRWHALGIFRDDERVSVATFDAISIHLEDLWG